MPGLLRASTLTALVLFGSEATGPQGMPTHRFELVSAAQALNADGSPKPDSYECCLFGEYPAGQRVHLLSDTDSTTCVVETGRVGESENGKCTVLVGVERCTGSFTLGVLGTKGDYRRLEARQVKDEATRGALERAIRKAKVVENATVRWSRVLEGVSYQDTVDDAVSWPGLDRHPTLVRLKFDHQYARGPWVAIERGKPETIVGPFTLHAPTAFTLDGRSYLVFTVGACLDCGAVGTEVHAVRAGRLQRVLESFANAD